MMHPTIPGIIKTSIVTAFTLAAALIWKDVIIEAIELFVPGDALIYKFLAAIVATILVIIAIYVVLETESEAEAALKRIRQNHFHQQHKR